MPTKSKNLTDVLFEAGKITNDEAVRIHRAVRGGKDEEDMLLGMSKVEENDVLSAKAKIFGLPAVKIDIKKIDPKLFQKVTEEAVKQYGLIPLAKRHGFFEFGLLDPGDVRAEEAAKFVASEDDLIPKFYTVSKRDFDTIIKRYKDIQNEVKAALEQLERELEKKRAVSRKKVSEEEIAKIVEEAPTIKMVEVILRNAVDGRASDVHIEPTAERLKVRFRVDGVLHASLFLPMQVHPTIVSRVKILSNLKIDETRIPQDGRFRRKIGDKEMDFRVSTFPTTEGEKVEIRILDPESGLKGLPELGLTGRNLQAITKAIARPFGMILISGPTGSGKTTTLYAMFQLLNKEDVNVMSLEDPVEYYIEGVNQSQIRPEIGYDFASGLRHMVRQDPDIIMVGEIRDKETSALATNAALTGHLVLSTIHTNNAIGIIPRLIDMKVDPFLIAPSLSIGVAQRLVRRLCGHCKRKVKASEVARQIIVRELETFPEDYRKNVSISQDMEIYEAVGCKECLGKGYLGRIAIFEIIEMTPRLEKIIVESPTEANIEKEAKVQGMITMKQDGILKALEGITSLEEVLKVVE